MVEAHPSTESPNKSVLMIIIIMNITAKIDKTMPKIVVIYNGDVENDIMPSKA